MRRNLRVTIDLQNVHCFDEADGPGSAEPYLWAVFFKIDGETVRVTTAARLEGSPVLHAGPGVYGNLGNDDVDDGENASIPDSVGLWRTTLRSIAIPPPLNTLAEDVAAYIGVVCVLMEEDNVTNDGAKAGFEAIKVAVEKALNDVIRTRSFNNQSISESEVATFKNAIIASVSGAIRGQQNIFENIWSWLNKDDTIGFKLFLFSQDELLADRTRTISQRWRSEGDWELSGRITAVPVLPPFRPTRPIEISIPRIAILPV